MAVHEQGTEPKTFGIVGLYHLVKVNVLYKSAGGKQIVGDMVMN